MAIHSQKRLILSLRQPFQSYLKFISSISRSSSSPSIKPNIPSSPSLNSTPLFNNQSFQSSIINGVRSFASRLSDSSVNNNRPPKETIMLEGCDFEHWLVVVENPDPELTRDEIIDCYVKTLAHVIGSEEEARMKIYSVSTRHYFAFSAIMSEELGLKLKELPNVRWVLPDSYMDVKNKTYAGEPFINGQPVPYDPKYHEIWVRNHEESLRNMNKNRRRQRDPNLRSRSSASARGNSNQNWISVPCPQNPDLQTSVTEDQTSQISSSIGPVSHQQNGVPPADSRNEAAQPSEMQIPSHTQCQAQNQAPPTYSQNQAPPTYSQNRAPPTYSQNQAPPTYSQSHASPTYSQNQLPPTYSQNQAPPTYSQSQSPPTYSQNQAPPTYSHNQAPPTYCHNQTPPTYSQNRAPPTYSPNQAPPTYSPNQAPPTYPHNQAPPIYSQNQAHPTYSPNQSPPAYSQNQAPPKYSQNQAPQPSYMQNNSKPWTPLPPQGPAQASTTMNPNSQGWGSHSHTWEPPMASEAQDRYSSHMQYQTPPPSSTSNPYEPARNVQSPHGVTATRYQSQPPQTPIQNNLSYNNTPSAFASNVPYQVQNWGPVSAHESQSPQPPNTNNFSYNTAPPSGPVRGMPSRVQSTNFPGGSMPSQAQQNEYPYRDIQHHAQSGGSFDGYPSKSLHQQQDQNSHSTYRDMPDEVQQYRYYNNTPHHVQNGRSHTGYPPHSSQYQQYQNNSRDMQNSNATPLPQGRDYQSMTPSMQNSVSPNMPMSHEVQSHQFQGKDIPGPTQNSEYQHKLSPTTQNFDYNGRVRVPNDISTETVRTRDYQERDSTDDYMYASK